MTVRYSTYDEWERVHESRFLAERGTGCSATRTLCRLSVIGRPIRGRTPFCTINPEVNVHLNNGLSHMQSVARHLKQHLTGPLVSSKQGVPVARFRLEHAGGSSMSLISPTPGSALVSGVRVEFVTGD